MIETIIIKSSGYGETETLKKTTDKINELINFYKISKGDIVEYKTEMSCLNGIIYKCITILSWWK